MINYAKDQLKIYQGNWVDVMVFGNGYGNGSGYGFGYGFGDGYGNGNGNGNGDGKVEDNGFIKTV